MIKELPWIADGIDIEEKDAGGLLASLGSFGPAVFSDVMKRSWTKDGISYPEEILLWVLTWLFLDRLGPEDAGFIANSPFLDTVDLVDLHVLSGLFELWELGEDSVHFQRIWNHPALSDGIDDHDAETLLKLFVTGWHEYDPESIETLEIIDERIFVTEHRIINLPLAGEVSITIFRRRGTGKNAMDQIESDLRLLEEFMSSPYPQRQLVYVFAETLSSLATQAGKGGDVTIGPSLLSEENFIGTVNMHESAHQYWNEGQWWIFEGAPTFLEDVRTSMDENRDLLPFYDVHGICTEVRNLSELEAHSDIDLLGCNYTMGNLLFHDLYRNMGQQTFRLSFRHLYLLSRFDDPADECKGTDTGVCHVRAAFTKFVPESEKAAIETVIDKWYLGDRPRYWSGAVPWINGVLLGTDGQPLEGIQVEIERNVRERWAARTDRDGKFRFDGDVDPGTFSLSVALPPGCDSGYLWFDGHGLSPNDGDAADLVLDGITPFEPISITLPISSEDVHCGAKAIRGVFTGDLSQFTWIYVEPMQNGQTLSSDARDDGTFEARVPDGSRTQILVWADTRVTDEHIQLGWLGEDGIVQDQRDAKTFVIDGEDIEGIAITLPEIP